MKHLHTVATLFTMLSLSCSIDEPAPAADSDSVREQTLVTPAVTPAAAEEKNEMNDARSRIRLEYEDFQWKYPASVNGKPFDTIGEARTVRIIYDDRTIYSVEDPEFIFYKNLEHYPKLAVVNDSTYLYIFEHNLGEPEGTELAGVLFTAHRHIGTFFRDAEDAGIDMSKDYLGKTLLYQLQDTVNELLAEYD